MFWTCNEQCTANRKEFERRRKTYLDLNTAYLKGEADVRCMAHALIQLALHIDAEDNGAVFVAVDATDRNVVVAAD